MLRKLYDWVFNLARSRRAVPALAAVSFAESSVFPIPPDVMLAPMVLTRPERAYYFATVATLASVLGGVLGYAIGYFLTDLGQAILSFIGGSHAMEGFQSWYDRFGLWVILIKGLTPFPYKLVTIASGLAHFSFPVFLIASVITRGGRFFAVAYVIKRWGPAVWERVEKRLTLWTIIGLVVLIGAVVLLKVVLAH